ncbi:poly(ethylene terephthalate) hydrolase family protein [Gordonia iterans]
MIRRGPRPDGRTPVWFRRITVPAALLPAVLLLAVTVLSPVASFSPAAPAAAAPPVPAPDWDRPGGYTPQVQIGAVHTVYYPRELGRGGVRHPIVLWGNGTGAIPGFYTHLLRHYASHGFVTVAANTPTSNFAISMRWGIDLMARHAADPRSLFYKKVDLSRIAAAGHSQGGSGAINAAVDPRVTTVVAMAPGPLNDVTLVRDASVLYLAGSDDAVVWPALVRAMYQRSGHLPAAYLELRRTAHLEAVTSGGSMRAPSTAWLHYWLLGDRRARGEFFGAGCGYCAGDPRVAAFEVNRAAQRHGTGG